jgi:hypothetical protein
VLNYIEQPLSDMVDTEPMNESEDSRIEEEGKTECLGMGVKFN